MLQHCLSNGPDGVSFMSLAKRIEILVARLNPQVAVERRHDQRFPLPVLLKLTPIGSNGRLEPERAAIVLGKDVSRCGMSFFHERPLHYRRAIVSLEHPDFGWFAAEIDIHWCRFTKPGWYVSGGRLIVEVNSDQLEPNSHASSPRTTSGCRDAGFPSQRTPDCP
jgi:hypothetical protein